MASTELDKKLAKRESDLQRHKKKSARPQDNRGITGLEKIRTQGKGDKVIDMDWYSPETTKKLEAIFGKKKKTKQTKDEEKDR